MKILKNNLNLQTLELLKVIDTIIHTDKKEYFTYENNKCSDKEYLLE